jgi:hypothetical protein
LADVLSPARNLIRFAIFGTVASVAAALLLFRPSRRSKARNGALVAAAVVALVGIGSLLSSAAVEVQDHEGALTAAAQQLLAAPPSTRDGCATAPSGLSAGSLGPFEQVCITASADVEFRRSRSDGGTEGLIYASDDRSPSPPDTCVRELIDHWTQFARPVAPDCPSGYDFIGGG